MYPYRVEKLINKSVHKPADTVSVPYLNKIKINKEIYIFIQDNNLLI